METLTIHSQMDNFQIVDCITAFSDTRIQGQALFHQAPAYAAIEAMAQLSALHVRRLTDFNQHVFLLKINRCRLDRSMQLNSTFTLQAELISQSSRAFNYQASAQGKTGAALTTELMIATQNYDNAFTKNQLQSYFEKRWKYLYNDINKS